MTIQITLTPEEERKLTELARAYGKDPAAHAHDVVTAYLSSDGQDHAKSFAEILAPIREQWRQSGMTRGGVDNLLEREPQENRRESQSSSATSRSVVSGVEQDIDKLRHLSPNWDGYGAPAIDPMVIDAAKTFIAGLADSMAIRPTVVPISDGTLQIEWHAGAKSLEMEFESPGTIRFLKWDPVKIVEEEDTIDATDFDRAAGLIEWFMSGPRR